MNLTTLEQSKKLKEWGAPQDTDKIWWGNTKGTGYPSDPTTLLDGYTLKDNEGRTHAFGEVYAAYDLESLIEWIGCDAMFYLYDEGQWKAIATPSGDGKTTGIPGKGKTPLEAVFNLASAIYTTKE